MTAPALPLLRVEWLDLHSATVTMPDGGTCLMSYDWQRCGWTTDLPLWCLKPVWQSYADVIDRLREAL